jgi:hypothetical protein
MRLRLLEDTGTRVARTNESGVDVLDPNLDHLRDDVAARSDLRAPDVGDHERAVGADPKARSRNATAARTSG